MIRIITARRLRALEDDVAASKRAATAAGERDAAKVGEELAVDAAIRAGCTVETLTKQLDAAQTETDVQYAGLHAVIRQVTAERDAARAEAAAAHAEVEEARAQVLLDAEDRVALRALLRIAKKGADLSTVFALFERGRLHSVHASRDDAHAAAEARGAAPGGWVPGAECSVPTEDVAWRVEPLPLNTTK
ncbi:hypothetical protein ACF1CG_36920 [Streptomyces sp. NPDC014773]|uniref:hypothetical protein n=1 Tax=Streptomyces sp. NPDC014773 TaxID=3364908 RepID=UPI003702640B